uniref:Peptidase C1A papain C-terminal domain-containing protein n=1 Tax=Lygus hesperus TaxID=30085 RepID=A0A0K8STC3_LYGHE
MCCSHFPALGKLLVTVLMTCTLSVHAQLEFLQEPYVGWLAKSEKDNIFLQVWQHYNASSKYVKWYVETTNVYEWSMEENKLRYIFPVNTSDGVQFTECFFDTTNVTWAPFPDPRGFKPLGNNTWSRGEEDLTVYYGNIHGRQVPRLSHRKNSKGVEFSYYANHALPAYINNWEFRSPIPCTITVDSVQFKRVNGFLKKYVANEKHVSTGSRELGQQDGTWAPPGGWFPNPDTHSTKSNESFSYKDEHIPATWDWRKEGVVTDVKSQDQCGSCWAFATVGVIEGAYARKTHQLLAFSEQYVLDCVWIGNPHQGGCFGGYPEQAYKWIKSVQYLPESQEYRYLNTHGWCNPRSPSFVHIPIKNYGTVKPDVAVLKTALYHKGPLSVEFNLPKRFYYQYNGRTVFEISRKEALDGGKHDMVLVGYGSCGHLGGDDCFLIKNSWSDKWGLGGYFYIRENTLVELLNQPTALAQYVELE